MSGGGASLKEGFNLDKQSHLSEKNKETTTLKKKTSTDASTMDEKVEKNVKKNHPLSNVSNESSGCLMTNSNTNVTDVSQLSPIKRKNEMSNECVTKTPPKSPKKMDDERNLGVSENINQAKDIRIDQSVKDHKSGTGFLHPKKEDEGMDGKIYQERLLTVKILMYPKNEECHIQGIPDIRFKYKEINSKEVSKNENPLNDPVWLSQAKMIEFSPKDSNNQCIHVEPALFDVDDFSSVNNTNHSESFNFDASPFYSNNFFQTEASYSLDQTIYFRSLFREYIVGDVPNLEFDTYNKFHDVLLENKFVLVTSYAYLFDCISFDQTNSFEIAFISKENPKSCFYGYNPFLDQKTTNDMDHHNILCKIMCNEPTPLFFYITPHIKSNFPFFFGGQNSNHSLEKIKPKNPTKDQLLSNPYIVENRGLCNILYQDDNFYSLRVSDTNETLWCPVHIYVRGMTKFW